MVKDERQTRLSFVLLLVASVSVGSLALLPAAAQPNPATNPDDPRPSDPPVRVALVVDAGPAADSLTRTVKGEIRSLFEPATAVQFSRFPTTDAVDMLGDAHRTNAVIAVGPGATSRLCRQPDSSSHRSDRNSTRRSYSRTPVFAVSSGSGVLMADIGGPGTPCTVVGPAGWPSDTFRSFQRLAHFDQVDVVVDASVAGAVDGASDRVRRMGREAGVTARLVPVRAGTPSQPSHHRREKEGSVRRAVFLDHLDQWDATDVRALTGRLAEGSTAIFAYSPRHVTHHGALAAPNRIERIRARRAALAVEQVVRGGFGRASETPVGDTFGASRIASERIEQVVVNRSVARWQGVDARLVLRELPDVDRSDISAEARSIDGFSVQTARPWASWAAAVTRIVQARERQGRSTMRSFLKPKLSLEGAVSQRLSDSREGAVGLHPPLGSDGGGSSIPTPLDEPWLLNRTASLPLVDRPERAVPRRRASDQPAAARTRRRTSRRRVEPAARTALVDVEMSYETGKRALRAADAAQQTLTVTESAPREGSGTHQAGLERKLRTRVFSSGFCSGRSSTLSASLSS